MFIIRISHYNYRARLSQKLSDGREAMCFLRVLIFLLYFVLLYRCFTSILLGRLIGISDDAAHGVRWGECEGNRWKIWLGVPCARARARVQIHFRRNRTTAPRSRMSRRRRRRRDQLTANFLIFPYYCILPVKYLSRSFYQLRVSIAYSLRDDVYKWYSRP